MSGLSSANPKYVQCSSVAPGPRGSTWRTARQFWICCSTKPGKTVRICSWMPSPNSSTASSRLGPASRAHEHAAALREPGDPEGAEERVQEARVVGVLHVLDVELPVAGQGLDEAAEHPDRTAQH